MWGNGVKPSGPRSQDRLGVRIAGGPDFPRSATRTAATTPRQGPRPKARPGRTLGVSARPGRAAAGGCVWCTSTEPSRGSGSGGKCWSAGSCAVASSTRSPVGRVPGPTSALPLTTPKRRVPERGRDRESGGLRVVLRDATGESPAVGGRPF